MVQSVKAEMQEVVDVNTGKIAVRRGRFTLRSVAIGSCIVVAAFDSKTKNAGMAHVMLPGSSPEQSCEKTKYAADGIEQLLGRMQKSGSKVDDIEICLVGAGNVLKKKDDTICSANIKSVNAVLSQKCVAIKASILGGTKRKSLFLDAGTGRVYYTEGDGPKKQLYPPE